MKPDLTYEIKAYAMQQAKRLRNEYPKGLSSRDVAKELNCTARQAVKAMNRKGFFQWDKHYQIGDVAALLAYRYWWRKHQIKSRII